MENEGFNLIQYVLGLINAETIWTGLSAVGIASIISAFTSSKVKHSNPWIKTLLQTLVDLINIVAANIYEAKNADDDRPAE